MKFTHEDYESTVREALLHFSPFRDQTDLTEDERDHTIQIAMSILMTKDKFQIGGGFVHAVINNDLKGAFDRGDLTMHKVMRTMVWVNDYLRVKKFSPKYEKL